MKKGQAALEYLMTYGWAILIIAIVAAALYATGILNPATWVGTRSTGFSTIGISTWQYTATNGEFLTTFQNNAGQRINVTNITYDENRDGVTDAYCDHSTGLNCGAVLGTNSVLGPGATLGSNVTVSIITAGDTYTVSVNIVYLNAQGSARIDQGTLSGRAT